MSDNNQKNLNSRAVPFFARYLEGQSIEDLSTEKMETIKGSKFDLIKYNIFSRKYPSDHEDGSGNPFMMGTAKYPSDSDDR